MPRLKVLEASERLNPEVRGLLIGVLREAASVPHEVTKIAVELETLRLKIHDRKKKGLLFTVPEVPNYEGAYGYMLTKMLPEGSVALARMLLAIDHDLRSVERIMNGDTDELEHYLDYLLRRTLGAYGDSVLLPQDLATLMNVNQYSKHENFTCVCFEAMIAGVLLPIHSPHQLTHYLSVMCR